MKAKNKKILLVLLPFWDPQIPPLGISSLKAFLEPYGYNVKTIDANIVDEFSESHNKYFTVLEECVPEDRRGNFKNVGQDVFRNHLMAHLHHREEDETVYYELVKSLVYETFYTIISEDRLRLLHQVVENFYRALECYFIEILSRENPQVLGLSVYRGNLASSMFVFRLTRRHFSHIETLMGGAVFAGELAVGSENLQYFLEKTPYIDKMIAGEGELLFLKYLRGELPQNQRVYTLQNISGETLNINSAAAPDFSDLNLEFYPALALYSSRSCPYRCSFCTETVYWGKYRKKSPSLVVEQMIRLHEQYRSQLFLMCDSLLNPIITDLSHELTKRELSLYWDGYLRAGELACSSDNTILWRRGGFYRARLGIESGSPHVLKLMGKKITMAQIKSSIINLAAAGIKTTTYWVIGHPGETEEDFRQTLDIIEELRDDIYEAWCSPFNYYKTGQVNSTGWEEKSRLLYPEEAKELLVVQSWTLEAAPLREEAYRRMNRFVNRCRQLGIPNPFSIVDFHRADERWQKLHKNAVPPLAGFTDRENYFEEQRTIKPISFARKKLDGSMDFDF
jgi:hypothetical protein